MRRSRRLRWEGRRRVESTRWTYLGRVTAGEVLTPARNRTQRVSHAEILAILHNHGSIAYAMDTACAYAEAARLSISELPETDAKRALVWVPSFVTSRDR